MYLLSNKYFMHETHHKKGNYLSINSSRYLLHIMSPILIYGYIYIIKFKS